MGNARLEKVLVIFCAIISTTSAYIALQTNTILAYNDATAHLNTARRVFDNLTPGFVQLGSVWLPLLHLLQMPFVVSDYLWQSGLAGWIVSGASFVITGLFLYKLTFYLTNQKLAGIISVMALTLNANMLYLQTTAMFEPLLLATATGAIYYLAKWTIEKDTNHLIFSAFLVMLATLTRYDGWALCIACAIYVAFVSIIDKAKHKEGNFLLFVFLAGFGIFLWFAYNKAIFGDSLYFQRGEYSAKAQQDILETRQALPTKNNLPLSIQTYSMAVLLNVGTFVSVLFLLGIIYYAISNIKHPKKYAPLLLLIPYPFNIVSLFTGQSVIWTPLTPPFYETFFNIRYGILMLPAVGFFIAYLTKKHMVLKVAVVVVLVVQMYSFFNQSLFKVKGMEIGIVTIRDTVSSVNIQTTNASEFLKQNYDGGLILASSASIDAFIFRSGIPLKNYITEGTGRYWKESLQNPTKHATWIVQFNDNSDRVGRIVSKWKWLKSEYQLVYQDKTYLIWKRKIK